MHTTTYLYVPKKISFLKMKMNPTMIYNDVMELIIFDQ
jgi:hypothetical protein